MKYYKSPDTIPCYNYSMVMAGDLRFLIKCDLDELPELEEIPPEDLAKLEAAKVKINTAINSEQMDAIQERSIDLLEKKHNLEMVDYCQYLAGLAFGMDNEQREKISEFLARFGMKLDLKHNRRKAGIARTNFEEEESAFESYIKDIEKKNESQKFDHIKFMENIQNLGQNLGVVFDPQVLTLMNYLINVNVYNERIYKKNINQNGKN